jgi:hypothetical protein
MTSDVVEMDFTGNADRKTRFILQTAQDKSSSHTEQSSNPKDWHSTKTQLLHPVLSPEEEQLTH